MVMINKNPVSLACLNTNNKIKDIYNHQSQAIDFPIDFSPKFNSNSDLDIPIKLQVAFRNEFDDF